MTTIDRPTHHRPIANVNGSPPRDSVGRPSAQLIIDGVIAGYIHDISQRHRRPQASADAAASSERAALSR